MFAAFESILKIIGRVFIWLFIIEPWEMSIRVRLGKRTDVMGPGFHLRIPFIDTVYTQHIRVRAVGIASQTVSTSDGHTVTFAGSLRYKVGDILSMYQNVHSPRDTINQVVRGLVTDYVVDNTLVNCAPRKITDHVNENLKLTEFGLEDYSFFLTDFAKVKTYRLINGDLDSYYTEDSMNMHATHGRDMS